MPSDRPRVPATDPEAPSAFAPSDTKHRPSANTDPFPSHRNRIGNRATGQPGSRSGRIQAFGQGNECAFDGLPVTVVAQVLDGRQTLREVVASRVALAEFAIALTEVQVQ